MKRHAMVNTPHVAVARVTPSVGRDMARTWDGSDQRKRSDAKDLPSRRRLDFELDDDVGPSPTTPMSNTGSGAAAFTGGEYDDASRRRIARARRCVAVQTSNASSRQFTNRADLLRALDVFVERQFEAQQADVPLERAEVLEMKAVDHKDMLDSRKLSTDGNKKDLQRRLLENLDAMGQEIECLPWVRVRESGCASGGRDAVRTEGDSTHEHRCEQSGSKELPCPRRLAFDLDDVDPASRQTSTTCRGAGFTERVDQLHGRRSFTGTDLVHSPDFVAFRVRGLLSKGEERRGHRMMQHARQTLANRLLANEALSLSAQKLLSSELQSLVLDKDYERAAQVSAEPSVALSERSMPSAISGKEDEDDPTPSPLCATGRTRADMLAGPALPPPRRLASAFEATIRAVAHQRSFGFVPDELAWTPRSLPRTTPSASVPDDPLLAEVDAFLFQHRSGLSPRYLHANRSSTSTPSRGERHARSPAVSPVEQGDDDRGMSASRRLHQPSPKCDWECDWD